MSHRVFAGMLLLTGLMLALACDSPPGARNRPPDTPTALVPSPSATISAGDLLFRWQSSDPDGDSLTYRFLFGLTEELNEVNIVTADTSLLLCCMSDSSTFYWQVAAMDSRNDPVWSPVWRFDTRVPILYPLWYGTRWTYEGYIVYRDAETQVTTDSMPVESHLFVDRPEGIPDGPMVMIETTLIAGDTTISECYFDNLPDMFGYFGTRRGISTNVMPLKPAGSDRYVVGDRTFGSISELLALAGNRIAGNTAAAAGRPTEEYPWPVLKYPLEVGDEWTFNEVGGLRFGKRVDGTATGDSPYYDGEVFEISRLWDVDGEPGWDNVHYFGVDQISPYGLLKRNLTILDVMRTDYTGLPTDTVDIIEEYKLTEHSVLIFNDK